MHLDRPAGARRLRQTLSAFVPGRTAICALVLWSGYIAAWTAASGARAAIAVLWWLAGLALFQAIRSSAPDGPEADPVPLPASISVQPPAEVVRRLAHAVDDPGPESGSLATR